MILQNLEFKYYIYLYLYIYNMELYSNNINGPIPSDLGNLTNLVSLDLYLNRFTGPIPHHIQPILQVADEDYISILNNSF
jgi:somatic embryogenesis receptor kinase 1